MFDDLDWPLNASRGLSATEFLVLILYKPSDSLYLITRIRTADMLEQSELYGHHA